MNKNYLSLSISRQLASDYPIGDPFSGAAYGKREFPFIIAPAVAAVGTAVGFAATAVAVVGAVSAIATVVGIGLTVVGAVTGDKDLMKIGGIIGIAGGIGSLATSALSAGMDLAVSATAEASLAAAPTEASLAAAGAPIESTMAAAQAAEAAGTNGLAQSAGGFMADTAVTANAATAATQVPSVAVDSSGGALSSTGLNGVNSVAPSAIESPAKVAANVGTNTGSWTDSFTGLFKDVGSDPSTIMGSPQAKAQLLTEGLKLGAGALQGANTQSNADRQFKQDQQVIDYKLMNSERSYANGNTQGRLDISTAPWTPQNGQLTQAQIDAHVQIDANGHPIQKSPGLIARAK
jgi:hypothetical protein